MNKKVKTALHLAALAACILVGFGQLTGGIVGTDHDFSSENWSGGKICAPCHTPHGADTSVTQAPLWSHDVSTKVYALYTSPTLDATDLGQPDGVSKLCLSCHDGTVAIDSFGGNNGIEFMQGDDAVGAGTAGLSDDHPVSFTYDTDLATADGDLADPATALSSLGGTIAQDLLYGGKMECASCHDVHNGSGNANLLRIDNSGSQLCLTCHNK